MIRLVLCVAWLSACVALAGEPIDSPSNSSHIVVPNKPIDPVELARRVQKLLDKKGGPEAPAKLIENVKQMLDDDARLPLEQQRFKNLHRLKDHPALNDPQVQQQIKEIVERNNRPPEPAPNVPANPNDPPKPRYVPNPVPPKPGELPQITPDDLEKIGELVNKLAPKPMPTPPTDPMTPTTPMPPTTPTKPTPTTPAPPQGTSPPVRPMPTAPMPPTDPVPPKPVTPPDPPEPMGDAQPPTKPLTEPPPLKQRHFPPTQGPADPRMEDWARKIGDRLPESMRDSAAVQRMLESLSKVPLDRLGNRGGGPDLQQQLNRLSETEGRTKQMLEDQFAFLRGVGDRVSALPRPNLGNWTPNPNRFTPGGDASTRLPSLPTLTPVTVDSTTVVWLIVLATLAVVLWIGGPNLWRRAQTALAANAATHRPVDWSAAPSRAQFVTAFESVALDKIGTSARTQHHAALGVNLGSGGPPLATTYAKARYTPEGEPVSLDELATAQAELRALAETERPA